ncbi:MAG: CsgG/HfaB family protein [Verrucomicrobiota bacterium]
MKTKPFLVFTLLCGALLLAPRPALAATAAPPLTVAVLPFESSDDKLKSKAEEASTLLWAQLSAKTELWMVERTEVDKLLSEHVLSLSGITDPGTVVKAGNVLGARVLITGRLIRTGSTYVLVAKIMSTETSRVFGATVESASLDTLTKPAAELADTVAATLGKQAAVFTKVVEAPEARLARLSKLTKGKKLPSVQVKIGERDVTHPGTLDPAAETEVEKMLSELGFEIIDPNKSGQVADIIITGEGISQAGARNGQLVSARGRVEVQATHQPDGKILAVDRETAVAVDTAQAIAGKTALQNAAQVLVERLISKLLP